MTRIILLTPNRRFLVNKNSLGYQIPLGLVCIGGPLIDAGYTVKLIDNDLYGWENERLLEEIAGFSPDLMMIGHTGSTAAHRICLQNAQMIKERIPGVKIVYGGVFPSYAAEHILSEFRAIDFIVRGEGEETVLELVKAFRGEVKWKDVQGISFRRGDEIVRNPGRPAIQELDAYRPGYELVDWEGYKLGNDILVWTN